MVVSKRTNERILSTKETKKKYYHRIDMVQIRL